MPFEKFKNIAVVVQCRLSSTRLPQKALKLLGGRECLCWTLDAMKKVKAARYFLACDYDSKEGLEPVAKKCGWEIFAGDRDDVLGRFCSLVETQYPECDLIVRATGDNPFLFWEAAELSVNVFEEKYPSADYFTFSGLPHGSGVELFKAASILKARALTDSPYDKEHVGPALYRHQETFNCVFERAPEEFFAQDLRTTIDTFADYERARRLLDFLQGQGSKPPFSASQILDALKNPSLQKTVLIVPSVKAGRGTGHLRRALSLAKETGSFVFVPKGASLRECGGLVQEALAGGLKEWQIVDEPVDKLGAGWDLVVLDLFRSSKEEVARFSELGPLCSLDDGGPFCADADYLLDVIPSMPRKSGAALRANASEPALIPLPKNRRADFPQKIKTALVCVSGETRSGLSSAAVRALESLGVAVTEVSSKNPVAGLRERLCEYDLVATHYGFTAFEALAANCAVLLLATSGLHKRLSKKYGFFCLEQKGLRPNILRPLLENPALLQNQKFKDALEGGRALGLANDLSAADSPCLADDFGSANSSGLATFVQALSFGQKFSCPVCGADKADGRALGLAKTSRSDKVVARTRAHTFRRCAKRGMLYLAFSTDSRVQYEADYFGSEYKAQYGRTYLDDFDSIKAQGLRRAAIARALLGRPKPSASAALPALLDIGCAYGPFLAAAKEAGFEPFGTDISQSALSYVKETLGFKCVLSSFADFDSQKTFGVQKFDAVTMWYVIEHCQDLDALLRRVNGLLKIGGAFAFSTPSAGGASARFNRADFFAQSPRDHYSLWEPARTAAVLKKFGFKVVKIVPTGIHPERIGILKNLVQKPFIFRALSLFFKALVLGDTFEVYCKKIKDAR